MTDKNDRDDDDNDAEDQDSAEEIIIYSLDQETHDLIEIACNCLVTLAEAQVNEEAAQGLTVIAERLAERFSIARLDQEIHKNEDGEEELIFRPGQSLFPEAEDDSEADDSDEKNT